jgi:acetyl-CoA carboxylase carboxyl transferase subunit alpha
MLAMARLTVPVVCTIIGEGGSGGALALAVGDRVLMQENATYSVISPEGCAAILWRDAAFAPQAAEALKPTASHLLSLGVIDAVIEEPRGGAHTSLETAARHVREAVAAALHELDGIAPPERRRQRRERFRRMGVWREDPLAYTIPMSAEPNGGSPRA